MKSGQELNREVFVNYSGLNFEFPVREKKGLEDPPLKTRSVC